MNDINSKHPSHLYLFHIIEKQVLAEKQVSYEKAQVIERALQKVKVGSSIPVSDGRTCNVVTMNVMPGKKDLVKLQTVIALVRLQSTSVTDWLKEVPSILFSQKEAKFQEHLIKLEKQTFQETFVKIDQDKIHAFAEIFNQLSTVLNIKVFNIDEEYFMKGGLTEIQIFTDFLREYINGPKFEVRIEVPATSCFEIKNNDNAKKLACNRVFGHTPGELFVGHFENDLAIILAAYAMEEPEGTEKYGWKFNPYFKTKRAKLEIFEKASFFGSKKSTKSFLTKLQDRCEQLESSHKTFLFPLDVGAEYNMVLSDIIKKMFPPRFLVYFGNFQYIYMIYENRTFIEVQKFIGEYKKANRPKVNLDINLEKDEMFSNCETQNTKYKATENAQSKPIVDEQTTYMAMFKRNNARNFYIQCHEDIRNDSCMASVKIEENEEGFLLLKSSTGSNIIEALNALEKLYCKFLETQTNTDINDSKPEQIPGKTNISSETYVVITDADFTSEYNHQELNVKPGSSKQKHAEPTHIEATNQGHFAATYMYVSTNTTISVSLQSILDVKVDAIVNTTSENLNHSAGISKVIANAAGKAFIEECRNDISVHGPLPTGQCCVTGSGNLTKMGIHKVIHTVGPKWTSTTQEVAANAIYNCYWNSLREAGKNGYKSIAFPAISTGNNGAPLTEVAKIAIDALMDFLRQKTKPYIDQIHLVDIQEDTVKEFIEVIDKVPDLKKLKQI